MEGLSVLQTLLILYAYAALISIGLLLERRKFCLSISYVFVFYWGYVYNQDAILKTTEGSGPTPLHDASLYLYVVFGLAVILLALITFYKESKRETKST